jgi:hypothetical protein
VGQQIYCFPESDGSCEIDVQKNRLNYFQSYFMVYSLKTLILPAFQGTSSESLAGKGFHRAHEIKLR